MATDLRSLITAIRMVAEIERSADLAVNITKAARRMYGVELNPKLRGLIERLGEKSSQLFRLAIDAYVDRDAALAAALDDMDDAVDALHRDYISAIFETHGSGFTGLQPAVQLALVGRYYERIGDHAVNIGERVRYMVTGSLPDHTLPVPPPPDGDEDDEAGE
jgi:phosphate transport system protein